MSDQHLLSELCSICHTQPPKYRCPRCQTKTCSLACVKRHKTRAQCSGQRDPTAYVKKRQLGTAAGIDHDFNFIRSVERGIDRGTDVLHEHGYDDQRKWQKHFAALQRRMGEVGVVVQKAPTGLSRSKENATHWGVKTRSILWTVEWILEDQSRHLDSFSEHTALEQAHQWLLARLDKKRKDGAGEGPVSKRQAKRRKNKRGKIDLDVADQTTSTGANDQIDGASTQNEAASITAEGEATALHKDAPAPVQAMETNLPTKDSDKSKIQGSKVEKINTTDQAAINGEDGILETSKASTTARIEETPTGYPETISEIDTNLGVAEGAVQASISSYYYLIRPRTTFASKAKVLIPLAGDATLATCLKGQLILEYPSLQVLSHSVENLPDGYITAAEYSDLERQGKAKLAGQTAEDAESTEPSAAAAELEGEIECSSDEDSDIEEADDLDVNIEGFISLDNISSKASASTPSGDPLQDSRISNASDLMAIQRDLVG